MGSPIRGFSVSLAILNPAIITNTETTTPTNPSMFTCQILNTIIDKIVADVAATSPKESAAVAVITLE